MKYCCPSVMPGNEYVALVVPDAVIFADGVNATYMYVVLLPSSGERRLCAERATAVRTGTFEGAVTDAVVANVVPAAALSVPGNCIEKA